MPQYKLIYFNIEGRAEVIRYLFEIAGVEYVDERLERSEWEQHKLRVNPPFDQLPILEVDGQRLCQSHAIERYLAKIFGLAGSTAWETARCDMITECAEDMLQGVLKIHREPDTEKKEELKLKYLEYLDRALINMNKLLEENSTNSGYFVGNGLTYTDLVFWHFSLAFEYFLNHKIDWGRWPKLQALREMVGNHEKVADWIKRRPKTEL